MQVPLLDIRAQNEPLRTELLAAVEKVLDSGAYILGPEVEALEREVASLCGCSHGIGITSGTDALLVALMALDIGPGDEVLVPAFTFFATAGCVARLGATPVFVDVRVEDFNMDPEDLAAKVTPRTKAILPVHLYGQAAPMEEILEIAAQHGNIPVIEDAAQALGGTRNGKGICSFGAMGITSFYPTKNLGAFGDAGMLLTSDDKLASKCRQLRNHGMEPRYYHPIVGGNFRLDGIQGALLRVKLPHLDTYARKRADHAAYYNDYLSAHARVTVSPVYDPDALLVLPAPLPGNGHVWNQYTVRVQGGRRDALRTFLASRGVGSEIYYPLTLDMQECFQGKASGGESCTRSHQLTKEVLSLPIYPEMSDAQLQFVAELLEAFCDS